jgi:cytidyltransferase-like protein
MKEVNITIGRFQPLTNGHMSCIETAFKKLKIPTVICMIGVDDKKVDEKHPFPSDMLLPLYKEVFEKSNMVADVVLVKNANIVDIGQMLYDKGYVVRSWSCGTDRLASYKKMADKYADDAKLSEDFEMLEIKRTDEDISATKVREAILNNDYRTFAAMTPLVTLKSKLKGKSSYDILREQLLKIHNK